MNVTFPAMDIQPDDELFIYICMKYLKGFFGCPFLKGGLRLQEGEGGFRFSVQSGPGTCSESPLRTVTAVFVFASLWMELLQSVCS